MTDSASPSASHAISRYRRAFVTGEQDSVDSPEQHRRRLLVVVVTVLVGVGVNAWALRIPPGDSLFYLGTALLALVWLTGAFASGPIHLGHEPFHQQVRPLVSSIAVAAVLVVLFCVGALVVAQIPLLRQPVLELLEHADAGNLAIVAALTAINGVAEECFHRGAVYSAAQRHRPIVVSTMVYAAVTATSGIPLLVVAAVLVGVVTAVQRRCTGGILGPAITHVAWSMVMLLALGPILEMAG